ncbi:MAG: ATP-dependent helicase [Promethearchaeota archaeon]
MEQTNTPKINKSLKNGSPSFNKVSFKDNLNVEQFNIVKNINGSMIVIAGAGSGKTRTITYGVAKLIESGVKPTEIMLVTFTNKAAKEMLLRVKTLLGKEPNGIWGGTFHSLANRFIRSYTHLVGLKTRYTIIDQTDSYSLMKLCIEDSLPNYKLMNFPNAKRCFKILSYKINTNRSIQQVLEWKYPHLLKENFISNLENIFIKYNERKIQNSLIDFNDLLVLWNRLLEEKEIAQNIAEKIKYILVDEYQDTNFIQAEIILKIAQINQNIIVVGDDAQSIYSFRGADFKNLLNFGEKLKNIKKHKITYNYRSTPEILDLANSSIKNNQIQFHKTMKTVRKSSVKPKFVVVFNEKEQSDFIVQKILDFREQGFNLSEIAILYRSNFHSIILQKELQANAIPYEVRSGVSFFEQAHIKDVLAHLKIIFNPYDELSWSRIFKIIPKLGMKSARRIFIKIKQLKDPLKELNISKIYNSDFKETKLSKQIINNLINYLKPFVKFSLDSKPSLILQKAKISIKNYLQRNFENFNERLSDIDALIELSLEFKTIRNFLDHLNLNISELSNNVKRTKDDGEKDNQVVLSTIHKAKGLEWKIVFIISLSEKLFPSSHISKNQLDIEEERRVFYVAVTRAKDDLYLITIKSTQSYNKINYLNPSRFVIELDPSLYDLIDYSNNSIYNKTYKSDPFLFKKKESNLNKEKALSQFTTADKLLKRKN